MNEDSSMPHQKSVFLFLFLLFQNQITFFIEQNSPHPPQICSKAIILHRFKVLFIMGLNYANLFNNILVNSVDSKQLLLNFIIFII